MITTGLGFCFFFIANRTFKATVMPLKLGFLSSFLRVRGVLCILKRTGEFTKAVHRCPSACWEKGYEKKKRYSNVKTFFLCSWEWVRVKGTLISVVHKRICLKEHDSRWLQSPPPRFLHLPLLRFYLFMHCSSNSSPSVWHKDSICPFVSLHPPPRSLLPFLFHS